MLCTIEQAAAKMSGHAQNDLDPLVKPQSAPSDWGEYLHEQEGGVLSIAGRLGKAAGIEAPDRIKGLMKAHNPLMEMLKGGDKPNVAQRALFDFLSPAESVAKPVMNEYLKARNNFETLIKNDPALNLDAYKDEVVPRFSKLLKEIKADPSKYGVDSGNVHMTTRFLQQVENGWPYADYAGQAAEATQHLEPGLTQGFKAVASNAMRSHVTLNPSIFLFHMGTTPVRLFSQYPVQALKILPELFHDPAILIGKKLPEAEAAGAYSKALDTIDPRKWSKRDWGKALTGIPQTQTFNESVSFLLSKHGVPLDEALDRIALSSRDPLEMPMFLTTPDRGGSVSSLAYMRYAMYQHAAYLNMIKRMANFKEPEMAAKAFGSFLLYTGINYALYGQKAAIPGAGIIKSVANYRSDGTPEEEDEGGNLVYKATGMDLGEHMSPLSFFDLYHSVKMVQNIGTGLSHDQKVLFDENTTTTAKALSVAHALAFATEFTNIKGFTTPHSVANAVKSYGKAVDDAADNPLEVDWDEFFANEIQAHMGQRTANKFKKHANQ